jgi:apolipoprotein N-acyltransferase
VAPGLKKEWMFLLVYPAVSGLILGAAFPPLPLGVLAYVALIPLFISAQKLSGRPAFSAGFLQGIFFYLPTIYWISWVSFPGMLVAVFYMSVFRGLFTYALSRVLGKFGAIGFWSAPFLWVGFEYFNSLGDLGFPWVVVGNSQSSFLPLIQYASVTGVYGVSFWVVVVNLVALALLRDVQRRKFLLLGFAALFIAPLLQGYLALSEEHTGKTVAVAAVQPDMPPVAKEYRGFKYNFGKLKPMTELAAEQGAQLIVWPETAVGYLKSETYKRDREQVQHLVDTLNVHLYTGAYRLVSGDPVKVYNSSFLFAPGKGITDYYDKTRLVPFGERAPFPELLPLLRKIQFSGAGFVAGNWDSGDVQTVFEGPGVRFSAVICFDSVFPGFVSEFVAKGAELLVVITNDGWFGRSSGPYQHAEASVFRAIENRRSVVRCANTGVSTLVDPYGRQSETTGIFHPAVITGEVAVRSDLTFYTRYGDLFSQICLVIGLVLVLMTIRRGSGGAQAENTQEENSILPGAQGRGVDNGSGKSFGSEVAMPFLDHLEELRWRLLRALAGVVLGAAICGIYSDEILRLLVEPIRGVNPVMRLFELEVIDPPIRLIYLKPMGMFMVKLQIALVGGAILALPLLLYQLWLFVAPGLFDRERYYVAFIIFSSTVCFLLGAVVAYSGVVPLSFRFLISLGEGVDIEPQFDIGFYIGFVLRLLVAFGVVFELPVATFFLAKVGVVTSEMMRKGRRYAVVVGFVLAALLTPPDPISQMMMALPLVVLYELSIWVARVAGRNRV